MSLRASILISESGSRNVREGRDVFSEDANLKEFLLDIKDVLIQVSQDALREEQRAGFDPNPITIVDGIFNKPISAVFPLGSIEFVSTSVEALQVIKDTYAEIYRLSKIVTGTYIAYNYVFVNGRVVARTVPELDSWIATNPQLKPRDIIRFVNLTAYARRLEYLGVTAQRQRARKTNPKRHEKRKNDKKLPRPNGVYYLATRVIRAKYRGNVGAYFGFILGREIDSSLIPSRTLAGKKMRNTFDSSRNPKNSGSYLYPSVKLVINSRGTV